MFACADLVNDVCIEWAALPETAFILPPLSIEDAQSILTHIAVLLVLAWGGRLVVTMLRGRHW